MNLMTFKIGVLGRAYNPDYTSRSMRPAQPDILWQWRNIWGSILFVLQILNLSFHKILPQLSYINQKVYRNVPKVETKAPTFSRERNKCMFQLFRLSFIFEVLFFQYLGRMFQLLGLGCSNYWELKWVKLSCLLIQQLSVESKKLDL